MKLLSVLMLSFMLGLPAFAHGGGLNAQGCHNNRKTGDYHCHRPQSSLGTKPVSRRPVNEQPQAFTRPATPAGGAFRNCAHARSAGAAPVRRGDPGYGRHLVRDNDGVGCE